MTSALFACPSRRGEGESALAVWGGVCGVCSKHRQEERAFGCGQAMHVSSVFNRGKKRMMSGWAAKVRKQGGALHCCACRKKGCFFTSSWALVRISRLRFKANNITTIQRPEWLDKVELHRFKQRPPPSLPSPIPPHGLGLHSPFLFLALPPYLANAWPTTSLSLPPSSPSPSPLCPCHKHPQHPQHYHRCPPPSLCPIPSPYPLRHARVQGNRRIPRSFPQVNYPRPFKLHFYHCGPCSFLPMPRKAGSEPPSSGARARCLCDW